MSEINDGGPAFPETRWDDNTRQEVQWMGMTLRDYFAAKAMQAAIIGAASWGPCVFSEFDVDAVSEFANRQADAMLKAREA